MRFEDDPHPMMIRILFFAKAREAAATDEILLPLESAPDSSRLWDYLVVQFPQLAAMRDSIRLSRNSQFVQDTEGFAAGDEIALIPPVSGG